MNTIYSGVHWNTRKRYVDDLKMELHLLMLSQLRNVTMFAEPVEITITYPPDKLDIDNHAVVTKLIIDCLRGMVIKDDSPKWLRSVTQRFGEVDEIEVEVGEVCR